MDTLSHNKLERDESPLWVMCCNVSRDITPLLTSFLPSKGPDIQRIVGIGHPGVVIGDMAYSACSASFVENMA
jgi:hypothetical protein